MCHCKLECTIDTSLVSLTTHLCRFLMAQSYSGLFTFYAWLSDSVSRPPSRRAASLAFINAFSQLGNIAGSYIWPAAWAPSYRYSYMICISCSAVSIILCFFFRLYLIRENRRLETLDGPGQKGFRYML